MAERKIGGVAAYFKPGMNVTGSYPGYPFASRYGVDGTKGDSLRPGLALDWQLKRTQGAVSTAQVPANAKRR